MKSKFLKIALSIILILISYFFIVYKILDFKELKDLSFSLKTFTAKEIIILIIVCVLMLLNWSIETIKWKYLINKIQYFSFADAFKAVLFGVTIGIFTPNRIGEIGGRVSFLDKGKKTFAVLATGIGSFAQFITTFICGTLGLIIFFVAFPDYIKIDLIFNNLTVVLLLIFLAFLFWSYFSINKLKSILSKFSFFKIRTNQLNLISETRPKQLTHILILSILRYLVFITQFYLILKIFNINLTLTEGYVSISLIYLFSTIIPTTTLAELGIRGSLAIFFIGMYSENILGIVLSSIFLWIINLAIPSIIGSFYFIKNKL